MAKGSGADTIIAKGVEMNGELRVDGNIFIDGDVKGTVISQGDLNIGSEAKIEANLQAKNAIVAGVLRGTVEISEKLEILETAEITGDITAGVLSVAGGATINGTIRMGVGISE